MSTEDPSARGAGDDVRARGDVSGATAHTSADQARQDPANRSAKKPGHRAASGSGNPGRDAGRDAGRDVGRDVGRDAGQDAGRDVGLELSEADSADLAAASALARARESARAKGLRPGSRPMRKRRPVGQQGDPLSGAGRDGRDPSLLGDQLDRLLVDRGWTVDVAVGSVMGRWPAIVGTDVAGHCTPMTFGDGVLTVRAESTSWATQLRLMSSSILARLDTEVGKGVVSELRVQGPSAPSWTRGSRKSTGPGPRDTYG